MYGDRTVWVFSNPGELVNIPDSNGCTLKTRTDFESGIFYSLIEVFDVDNWNTSLGITGKEYHEMANRQIPNFSTNPLRVLSHVGYDLMNGLIFITDAVEKRLNSMGSSWRFHIEDPTKRDQLEQIITQSIYDVEFNLYSGRVDYKPGEKRTVVASGL